MGKINLWNLKRTIDINKVCVFLICCFFCAVSIFGGELDYAGNDDTFRNLISAGAFGDKFDYYIPNSNVLFGIPMALMYRIIPGINWYYWVLIIINLLAIYGLCAVLCEEEPLSKTLLYTTAINIILARDYYIAIQFTKSGSLWVTAGILLCIYKIYKSNRVSIPGLMLFAYGVTARIQCLYMMLPFAVLFVVYAIIRADKSHLMRWSKSIVLTVIAMIVFVIVALGAEKIFRIANPEWADYWEYDKASVYLRYYTYTSYDHNPEGYDRINTDHDDIELYHRWLFGDTEFFTTEWSKQVAEVESVANDNSIRVNAQILLETFKNLIGTFTDIPFQSAGVMILSYLAMIIVFGEPGVLPKLFALGNLAGVYMLYFYFTCVGRFMWRAELGAFIATAFILLFSHKIFKADTDSNMRFFAAVAIIITFVISIGYAGYMTYNWRYIKEKHIVAHEVDITGRLYEFNNNEDSFYFLTDYYVTNNPMNITRTKYKDIYKNVAYLGNWVIPSPTALYYANERGITNPMRALIDNENTYIWAQDSESVELIARHLSRIYGTPVHSELIDQDKEIYRICPD